MENERDAKRGRMKEVDAGGASWCNGRGGRLLSTTRQGITSHPMITVFDRQLVKYRIQLNNKMVSHQFIYNLACLYSTLDRFEIYLSLWNQATTIFNLVQCLSPILPIRQPSTIDQLRADRKCYPQKIKCINSLRFKIGL